MSEAAPILIAFGIAALLLLGFIIGTLNKLTRLKNLVRESWAQVDVALKRRYDLIPNLVETCKAYAKHEQDVFTQVVEARNQAMSGVGGVAQQASVQSLLVASLNGLLARVEAYPELKASQHFLELQQELANTEDRIAAARRFYNANVRDYNTAREQFPTSLLAGGYAPVEYFEIDSLAVRSTPSVKFPVS